MYLGLDADGIGNELLYFGESFLESGLGDVGHEDAGPLSGEEDGGFETDTTVDGVRQSLIARTRERIPSGASDDGILAAQTASRT